MTYVNFRIWNDHSKMRVLPVKLSRYLMKLPGASIKGQAPSPATRVILQMPPGCKISDLWRVPPNAASEKQLKEWEGIDNNLHSFLAKSIPEALQHTGSAAFDEHLLGVQAVLRHWGAHEAISKAGLFHSIYGTEGFQGFKLPFTYRSRIRELIGERSERLVWRFCVVDRFTVDQLVAQHLQASMEGRDLREQFKCLARAELGRFEVEFKDSEEWLDFVVLVLADWLEQVEGAAEKCNMLYGWGVGEAWMYRREAYRNMAQLLALHRTPEGPLAQAMHAQVYAVEPQSTRRLHQPITPPMSDAAKEAQQALASVHE
ncbi:hypothetical protein CEUSTIGMA_g4175.t1 [Chlamydomonas eustigma]|uniref:DUF6817 domain-containing protein n=1 Tax=Chlamydomonas eustigma TaxID=1157962 RepID=A0A250X0X4_9CHLO|nr:hypothetical protein CEUSTIGMA_g4175.t1 [Chlamydomonas eustigma]|eukprot:GAX76728.1 hypothetical protein CEUSTIGMA_g4175.t1 [Chlamydomonas eustigma]